ncbi:YopX family protein [Bacillus pumilus]|nr:YopX family protein [Bacillus pumilus]
MQYTGLKDCKGVEIYEEDIVQTPFMKSKGYAYRCVYSSKVGAYLLVPFKVGEHITPVEGVKEFAKSWEEIEHEGEVIGNIYEHPELIQSSYA